MSRSRGLLLGITFIAIGVLLLLDNMYIVDFGDIVHTYWPVLLIVWGVSKIGRRSFRSNGPANQSTAHVDGATSTVYPGTEAHQLSASTVFGDYTVAVQSKSFAGGTVSTTFGNTDIDLLGAELAESEHSLNIDGVFGNTTLHLPRQMAFAIHANTTFGNIGMNDQRKEGISPTLDFVSPDFEKTGKRIRMSVVRVFGNITIVY